MITVRDLSYIYAGMKAPALRQLTFDVVEGEIFGFLGPSGAGKSTTQKILNGLLPDYDGSVQVLGRELHQWGSDLYERIGVSFELPNHYLKLTALENLRYFASLYQGPTAAPSALLDAVGLANDGHMLVSQFSKGMKNRLSVARALLHSPDLLFLDEPTTGLDPVNARRIKALIQAQRGAGKTIFLTTHDMHAADELCDRVGFIVDGTLVAVDAPRALRLRHGQAQVRVEAQLDGSLTRYTFSLDGLADDQAFLRLLRGGKVQTIHTQEATMAEIFIEVTGRQLS